MPVFHYRLATLLDQREGHKQECERTLAERKVERRRAQEELTAFTQRQRSLEEATRDKRKAAPVDATGDAWQDRASDIALLQQRVEAAKDDVFSQQLRIEELEQRVAEAVEALRLATREVETLLKHRAEAERKFREAGERKEALEQEEIAAAMYEKRRRA